MKNLIDITKRSRLTDNIWLIYEVICNVFSIYRPYGSSLPLGMSVTVMRLYVFLPHDSLICCHTTENWLDKEIMIMLFPMIELMEEK